MTSVGVPPPATLPTGPEGPRNGILLNPHEAPPVRGRSADSKLKLLHRTAAAIVPPTVKVAPPPVAHSKSPPRIDIQDADGTTPRIRFAPLPDPHRPRSLSTGRNLGLKGTDGPNGREFHLELRNMGDEKADYENALDDEDEEGDDGDEDDDEEYSDDDNGRRKSWAVSMGSMGMGSMGKMSKSSWKASKKLLGAKPKEEEFGAPLKKSVSSGGITTSSPFKWTGSGDSSLFGTSPKATTSMMAGRRGSAASGSSATAASASAHRRGSSGELVSPAAKPARMLNGRMYGARRASEAAAMEKKRREKAEPSFVEWGAGGAGTVAKSLGVSKEDGDDGGGMAWVRRRREERERRAREEAEAGGSGDTVPDTADDGQHENNPMTESHQQRPASLSSSVGSSSPAEGTFNPPLTPHEPNSELHSAFPQFNGYRKEIGDEDMEEHDSDHHVHAVSIPNARRRSEEVDEDEEEDDGDFDNDDEDEEELLAGMGGVCASAAGVEILSRHRD